MFDVSKSLIRYWETEFTVLRPRKSRKGDRLFTVKDIRILEKIYTLVKERGFTLEGARKELKATKVQQPLLSNDQIDKLLELRKRLKNLRDSL